MPSSLTLAAYSDLDLLYALEETADEEGWATSEEVAKQIGLSHPNPNQCVGARFAWLYRFGMMDRGTANGKTEWRLNETGRELTFGKGLSAQAHKVLEKLSEGQRARATDVIARNLPLGSRQAAHLARRTWQHRFGTWRDPALRASDA